MKRFLLFILVLFYSPFVVGQGAATPQLAFTNPSSFWFQLDQDFTNGGDDWDVVNSAYSIGFNASQFYLITAGSNPRIKYDAAFNSNSCGSPNLEEWFVVKVPSTKYLKLELSVDIATNPGYTHTSIQWYGFDILEDLDNINLCNTSTGSIYIDGTNLLFPGVNSVNADVVSINSKYLAIRIGNNDFIGGLISTFFLSVSTSNSDCQEAISVPITDGTKDPFFGDTDKEGVLVNNPPSTVGQSSTFYGADGIIASSTGLGNWFTASSLLAENIYGALCGSAINPQLMIYTQCPQDDPDEYIGGENQNSDAAANLEYCVIGGNNPNWPVIKFPANVANYFFYIYSADGVNGEFDFYLFNNLGGGILPVTWLSFDGYAIGKQNRIQWRTASEQQNDYFILEKSKDGENYSELARVEGGGNSTFEKSYSFIDSSPYALTYYRISQVDWDGTIHSGPQTVVENNATINNFHVLTNPVETNSIQLSYYITKEENIQIDLYTVNGVKVYSENRLLMKENNNFTIPIDDMENGVYIISIKTNFSNYTQKIIINTLH